MKIFLWGKFIIFMKSQLIDPDTGESLGLEESFAGKLKITECRPKFSQGKVLSREEDSEISVGCIVRPAEDFDEKSE